jgi:protocadherin Fat 1/2/3
MHNHYQLAGPQPLTTAKNVRLDVNDVNDENPLFGSPSYGLKIAENSVRTTLVDRTEANDNDITPLYHKLKYSLHPTPTDQEEWDSFQLGQGTFYINEDTGDVYVNTVDLDREKKSFYIYTVEVIDGSESGRMGATAEINKGKPNKDSAYVQIVVTDVNDNPPIFNQRVYNVTVLESRAVETSIIVVGASDADEVNDLEYNIIEGGFNTFRLNARTGEIFLASPLDYEKIQFYRLNISCSDGIVADFAEVMIHVKGVNDESPVFKKPNYTASICEETPEEDLPLYITRVSAGDADKLQGNKQTRMTYEITGSEATDKFLINNVTGEITLLGPLNRDPPEGRPTWSFNVLAHDNDGQGNSLSGVTEIIVALCDINDNTPRFEEDYYVEVYENEPIGTRVVLVEAIDVDVNDSLRYTIIKNDQDVFKADLFQIDGEGLITTRTNTLDREYLSMHVILVEARDDADHVATGTVTVSVLDVNDNCPTFTVEDRTISIRECDATGDNTNLHVLYAEDKDEDENNSAFQYVIEEDDDVRRHFRVDTIGKEGILRYINPIDIDVQGAPKSIKFEVRVQEGGCPETTPKAEVTVLVQDCNDECPTFTELQAATEVREDLAIGEVIYQCSATDGDFSAPNNQLEYKIDPSLDPKVFSSFAVDQKCQVFTLATMDRDEGEEFYVVTIIAEDKGVYPEACTGTTTLTVNVKDLNDNAPEPVLTEVVCIEEEDKKEVRATTICAKDKDKPPNAGPFEIRFPIGAPNTEYFDLEWDRDGDGCDGNGAGIVTKKEGFSFDYEEENNIKLPVILFDSGTPQKSATATVEICFRDIDDHCFSDGTKVIEKFHYCEECNAACKKPETKIGDFYVKDKDSQDRHLKNWEMHEEVLALDDSIENAASFFRMDFYGGVTMLSQTLDGTYTLKATVTEKVPKEQCTNTAIATITTKVKTICKREIEKAVCICIEDCSEIEIVDPRFSSDRISKLTKLKNVVSGTLGKF